MFLLVISALSGLLHLPIFPGIEFVFSSIVTVIIIMSYRPRWGIVAAILSSIYTIILWQQPYSLVIFTLEAVVIGFVYEKTNKNIVLIDALYWFIIGMPLIVIFYHGIIGLSWPALKLIFLKQTLNGIFNSLVGCMIIYLLNSHSLLDIKFKKLRYSTLIYNVIMIFVLIPTLGFVMYEGQNEYNNFQERAVNTIKTIDAEVAQNVDLFFNYQMTPIVELAKELSDTSIEIDEVQKILYLVKKVSPDLQTIYVANKEGKIFTIASLYLFKILK